MNRVLGGNLIQAADGLIQFDPGLGNIPGRQSGQKRLGLVLDKHLAIAVSRPAFDVLANAFLSGQ